MSAFIAFFLQYWRALLIAALATLMALFFSLWRGEVKAGAKFRAEVAAAGKAREEKTAVINASQNSMTKYIEANYEQGSTALRDLYGPGRVQPDSSRGKLSGISKPAKKPNAATPDSRSCACTPSPGEDQGLKSDCVTTTRQLLYLQDWILRQSEIPR